jgi:hypothetical protein
MSINFPADRNFSIVNLTHAMRVCEDFINKV